MLLFKDRQEYNSMVKKDRIWFRAKLYGWGWCPTTWQGFLVVLISILIFVFFWTNIMQGKNVFINSLVIFFDFVVLLIICFKKGEKPRWRWGK